MREAHNKICQNCKKDFTIEPDDFGFYEKIKVPPPTFCPECRLVRRMATFNVRSLYNRNCSNCDKKIVSIYKPESPYIVYCFDCYFSDEFDTSSFYLDYDFSVDFFTQYERLKKKVPQLCLEQINNNSGGCEYANYTYSSKNIYLSHNVADSEDVYYSVFVNKNNKICFDSLSFKNNELCYEIVESNDNYNCFYLTRSNQCIDSSFLFNCVNCQNCFMSTNQRNQNYVFRNQKLSRDEYKKALDKENLSSYSSTVSLMNEYQKLMSNTIVRFAKLVNIQNCTGDLIEKSKNCFSSFFISNSENIKYVTYSVNAVNDSYDILDSGRGEHMYECICTGRGNYNIGFCSRTFNTMESYYCEACYDSKNIFGCIGLKKKQYCILNKQYEKEEYFRMIEKIKKQMNEIPYVDKNNCEYRFGEFFPIELSSFNYNETMAYEQFPLTKAEVLRKGYKWFDDSNRNYEFTIESVAVPDNISDVNESILKESIRCEHKGTCSHQCTNAFRILPEELSFYKRMNLPIPHFCPNCRYFMRLKRTLPWRLWHRQCMCGSAGSPSTTVSHGHNGQCTNEFETSYAPDRPEIVYCEKCYQQEVY